MANRMAFVSTWSAFDVVWTIVRASRVGRMVQVSPQHPYPLALRDPEAVYSDVFLHRWLNHSSEHITHLDTMRDLWHHQPVNARSIR